MAVTQGCDNLGHAQSLHAFVTFFADYPGVSLIAAADAK